MWRRLRPTMRTPARSARAAAPSLPPHRAALSRHREAQSLRNVATAEACYLRLFRAQRHVSSRKSSRAKEWAQTGKRAAAAATGLRTSRRAVTVRIPRTRKVQPILHHRPAQREISRGSRWRSQVRQPPPDVGELSAVGDHLGAVPLPREVVQPWPHIIAERSPTTQIRASVIATMHPML